MSCPLSKYIHFAANDCGYSGSRLELVTTLTHPLFLKVRSEASFEDNTNWKEAVQKGPFADQFWEACCTELEISKTWMLGMLLTTLKTLTS
ncbi:hypothetical protein ACHAXR_003040, partial [Thalassiosira sp. AJA248-18]